MKKIIILLLVGLVMPILAKSDKPDKAQNDSVFVYPEIDSLRFRPLIPDSLDSTRVHSFIFPDRLKSFQYENGVVTIREPHSIELNPGGTQEVDPSVDLEMIQPFEARQKVILNNKLKQRRQHQRFKNDLEQRDDKKEKKEAEKKNE